MEATCATCVELCAARAAEIAAIDAAHHAGAAIPQSVLGAAEERPTRWWHCGQCGGHLERYRGGGDVLCHCGAWFNSAGQRLRDDWMANPAWNHPEDETGDLEGYERACLAAERY